MDAGKFINPYDDQTGFGKRLAIEAKQKSAIAWHVAKRFAKAGDLAMFIADGTTAARTFRAMLCKKEYRTRFVTNNMDVCIQYTCVPETDSRMHEPVLIDGSLDQDANAIFPRWDRQQDEEALKHYIELCDVVVMGASLFTWEHGPRTRHNRRQTIRKQVLRSCQDKTVFLLLTGGSFYSTDLEYGNEPAWDVWKKNAGALRHLHVVTCIPESVENEGRTHWHTPSPPEEGDPADWAYVKHTDAIRDAIEERFVEIKKGDWGAADVL